MQIQNVLKFNEIKRDILTDALKQYYDIKIKYPDFIVLFQSGSFFEAYFEDALHLSQTTGITLSRRVCKFGNVLLAGVPLKKVKTFVEKLLNENFKVALIRETDERDEETNLVKRKISNLYTKGCLIEQELLNPKENNYLAAIFEEGKTYEFAYTDISTGELYVSGGNFVEIVSELSRISPKELLIPKNSKLNLKLNNLYKCEKLSQSFFDGDNENKALNAIFNYSKFILEDFLPDFEIIKEYKIDKLLYMDFMTRKNLELVKNSYNNKKEGSILWAVDKCITPMGKRLLSKMIMSPLADINEINKRHEIIKALLKNRNKFNNFSEILRDIDDVSRLSSRMSSKTITPLEFLSLKDSLKNISEIEKIKKAADKNNLFKLSENTEVLQDYYYILDKTFEDDIEKIKEKNFIKRGANPDLDFMEDELKQYNDEIVEYEEHLKNTTGIKALKIKRKQGFFIEVNSSHINPVGDDFVIIQRLTHKIKYTTPTLISLESKIYSSEAKIRELKNSIISNLREYSKELTNAIREYGKTIAFLDVLNSINLTFEEKCLIEPILSNSKNIFIKQAAHPAAEKIFDLYNPVDIDFKNKNLVILTGKNGIGKSTMLKTLGVMVVLIQAGFFIPAKSADVPVFDKLFTVLSVSDDILNKKSTHQRQMNLVADALNELTENSLVIFDEIGKNTSYNEGLSLFLGLIKYLSEETRANVIASTHFLNVKEFIKNKENILFSELILNSQNREIKDGIAQKSDGIEIARLENLPDKLISYAKDISSVIQFN